MPCIVVVHNASPNPRLRGPRPRGFTMLELMVVVTVLAVIMAVAAPSFRAFLEAQQVKALAFDMTTDLLLARSEALKRNGSVSVERSGDGWSSGWTTVAWLRVEGTTTVAASERISTRNASAQAVTVSGAPATITFDFNGRVSSPTTEVRVTISTTGASRCVELGLSGRARSMTGACS